jgi:hypothetical protein
MTGPDARRPGVAHDHPRNRRPGHPFHPSLHVALGIRVRRRRRERELERRRQGNEAGAGAAGLAFVALRDLPWAAIAAAAAVLVIGAVILRFVSEGALIEGVVRSRQGGSMTTREGLRAGWAHWGVLLRIALLYFAATVGSLVASPCRASSWRSSPASSPRSPTRFPRCSSPCRGS